MIISFELTELVPYLPTITCGVNFSKTAVMHFHFVTMRSPEVQIWRIGKNSPKMQCSMMSAVFSTFGAKSNLGLTGMRSRDRESLTIRLIYYFYLYNFSENLLICMLSDNFDKNHQDYDTFETPGTYL